MNPIKWQRTPFWLKVLGWPCWREDQPFMPGGWRYADDATRLALDTERRALEDRLRLPVVVNSPQHQLWPGLVYTAPVDVMAQAAVEGRRP